MKIIIFKACQGSKYDPGIPMEYKTKSDASLNYKIASEADFLIAFSTNPGKSWS